MELEDAAAHLRQHRQAVLSVVDDAGWPHVTRVVQHFDGATCRVSLTDDRVKTRHLRDRPRATLHVRGDDDWHWVSVVADAAVGPVSTVPDDRVSDELLEVYEAIAGPHDDPGAFRRAMVDERRLVLTLRPRRVYGQL